MRWYDGVMVDPTGTRRWFSNMFATGLMVLATIAFVGIFLYGVYWMLTNEGGADAWPALIIFGGLAWVSAHFARKGLRNKGNPTPPPT